MLSGETKPSKQKTTMKAAKQIELMQRTMIKVKMLRMKNEKLAITMMMKMKKNEVTVHLGVDSWQKSVQMGRRSSKQDSMAVHWWRQRSMLVAWVDRCAPVEY